MEKMSIPNQQAKTGGGEKRGKKGSRMERRMGEISRKEEGGDLTEPEGKIASLYGGSRVREKEEKYFGGGFTSAVTRDGEQSEGPSEKQT